MKGKTIAIALIALVIAGGTGVLIQNWMRAQRLALAAALNRPEAPKEIGTKVLVAADPLPAGTLLKPKHVTWRSWPADGVVKSYVVKGKREKDVFEGAVVRTGIAAGEPIADGRVVKPGKRGFMAAVLMPGMRAVSVTVNRTTGISGFVFPGDRIDLILTHKVRQGGGKSRKMTGASETVLTGVRVLAVDQTTDDQNGKAQVAKTATLEVTPRQAELVAVATQLGKLSLSLRSLAVDAENGEKPVAEGPARRGRTLTRDTDVSALLRRNASNSQTTVVFVLRGSKVEEQKFGSVR